VLSSAWERDLPPMLAAERAALAAASAAPVEPSDAAEGQGAGRRTWLNAVVPLSALMSAVPLGLLMDGGLAARVSADPARLLSLDVYRESLMASENNTVVLFCAGMVAVVVAFAVPLARRDALVANLGRAFGAGARSALPPLAILLSAWALAGVCKDVGTGTSLVWALEDTLSGSLVPLASVAIAALVAFFTGTSWGTMAIVVPTVAPLAHVAGGEALLVVTLASVLDGAIFGDHCSPISDTTVMTCVATGCDLVDHVRTQLPYAFLAMGVAGTCGYLWAARGGALWLSYAGGLAVLTVTLWVLGRPVLHHPEK
jgi:Na+/H+ antiporter NhaC